MAGPTPSPLPDSRYVSLTTYRRTGRPVATPVWAAADGDSLVVWTRADSGKVKRLRHTTGVTVAPCDARGRLRGPAVAATAEFIDPDGKPHALEALARRYRWQWRLVHGTGRVWQRLTRPGTERHALIRIRPA